MATGIVITSFTPTATGVAIPLQVGGVIETYSGLNELAGRVDGTSAVTIGRARRYPKGHAKGYSDREIALIHYLKTPVNTNRQTLEGIYSPWTGPGILLFEEDGVSKQAEAMPLALARHAENPADCGGDNGIYQGTWTLLSNVYYAPAATTTSPSTVPGTLVVAQSGKIASRRASITLTPTATKTSGEGLTRRKKITIANTGPREWVDWPLCLTPDGWDHAAEVTATRSLSTGYDVEVYLSGVRVPRWAHDFSPYDWAETTTRVWTLATMPPARRWVGQCPITAGATRIKLQDAADDLPALPFYAIIQHNTSPFKEVVSVTDYDASTRELVVVRGRRDTAADDSTGSGTVYIYWATGIYDLCWGRTDALVPDYIDDRLKPLVVTVSGADQTNDAWTYVTMMQTEASDCTRIVPRGGTWLFGDLADRARERADGDGDLWQRYIATVDADSATEIGATFRAKGAIAGQPLVDRVTWNSPREIIAATLDYEVTSEVDLGGVPREGWLTVGYIDRDGNVAEENDYSDTLGTHTYGFAGGVVGLFARYKPYDIQAPYVPDAVIPTEPTGKLWKVSAMTVEFGDPPLLCVGSSDNQVYQIGRPDDPATIANTEGETIKLYGPIVTKDDSLTLDVETHAATLVDEDNMGRAHLTRGAWPAIPAGATSLTYAETFGASVSMEASYRSAWA